MDLIVTLKCNNNCIFCPRGEFLSLLAPKTRPALIKEIASIRKQSENIVISGGEATCYKDLNIVLDLCSRHNFKNISLVTNGRNLTEERISDLNNKGINDLAISIYSHKRNAHNAITRSKKSFDETLSGIKNALRIQKTSNLKVRLNIVLSSWNHRHIIGTINTFYNLGVNNFIIAEQLLINISSKHLNLNQIKNAISKIKKIQKPDLFICLKGFLPCLIFTDKESKIKRNDLDDPNIRRKLILKKGPVTIEWEILNFDSAVSIGVNESVYQKKIKSHFSKRKACLSCFFERHCLGFQKPYLTNE